MKKIKAAVLLIAVAIGLSGCAESAELSEQQQMLKQEGMELQASGDYAGAIDKYEEALKLSNMKVEEEEIDLAYYKASAQYRSGDLMGAIDTYSAILDVREEVDAYLGRGLLYVEAKEAKKAEADLNKALKETNDPLIRGIIYQVVDQTELAKENFEKAKEAGNSEAVFYLAGLYDKAGDRNYAIILLEEYIAGGGASAEGYLTLSSYYIENEEYEKALELLQAGSALGESGVLKKLLQDEIACYEKLGDYDTAKSRAEAYLEKYPDDEVVGKEYEFLKSR